MICMFQSLVCAIYKIECRIYMWKSVDIESEQWPDWFYNFWTSKVKRACFTQVTEFLIDDFVLHPHLWLIRIRYSSYLSHSFCHYLQFIKPIMIWIDMWPRLWKVIYPPNPFTTRPDCNTLPLLQSLSTLPRPLFPPLPPTPTPPSYPTPTTPSPTPITPPSSPTLLTIISTLQYPLTSFHLPYPYFKSSILYICGWFIKYMYCVFLRLSVG